MGNCFRQSAGPNLFKSDWLAEVAKSHAGIAALLAEFYSIFASIEHRRIGYKSSSSLYSHESTVEYMGKDTVVYLSIFILPICYSPMLFSNLIPV
jgi:hypothetical protein